METSPFPERPLDAALAYAAAGLRVFPLHAPVATGCSCSQASCTRVGKHPRITRWQDKATTDPDVIRGWWARWPDANVAVATGAGSAVVVLDVDAGGGEDILAVFLAANGRSLPETLVAESGGGGHHYVFTHPGRPVKTCAGERGGPGRGVDVRGDGGYVVAAPSLHRSGRHYQWLDEFNLGRIAAMPDWLAFDGRLTSTGTDMPKGVNLPEAGRKILEGSRNTTLTSMAGSMRRAGFSEEAIFAALQVTNGWECVPPLGDDEVARIARSAARYAPTETELRAELAETRRLYAAAAGLFLNPHLADSTAKAAFRIATEIEAAHARSPNLDGFYWVSNARIMDRDGRGKPVMASRTVDRAVANIKALGLFKVETRRTFQHEPTVDPTTGEIVGTTAVLREERWVKRDRRLVEVLEHLARFNGPSPSRHAPGPPQHTAAVPLVDTPKERAKPDPQLDRERQSGAEELCNQLEETRVTSRLRRDAHGTPEEGATPDELNDQLHGAP